MARQFTGGSYASTSTVPVSGYPFTMLAWASPTDATNFTPIMSLNAVGDSDNALIVGFLSDVAYILAFGGGGASGPSCGPSTDGAMQLVGGVFASSTSRTVYHGSMGTEDTTPVAFPTGLDTFYLGADNRATLLTAEAAIAEAFVWDVALTQAEIARIAAGASPLSMRPESIVWGAHLKRAASPEIDLIGTNDLTVSGTAATATHPTIVYGSATYYQIGGDFGGLGMAANGPAFARANGTVSSTALALTDSPFSFSTTQVANANRAVVTANSNPVVIMYTGDAPTATSGIHVPAYMSYPVDGNHNVGKLKIIRAGSDSTVTVTLHA